MARLRARIPVLTGTTDVDAGVGVTVKFYEPGTASASGSTTSGTPFAGSLYAAVSGGSPISTTQTANAYGEVVVYTATKTRFDVGFEYSGGARVGTYESFEFDPADVMTSVSGEQSVIQTGTLAAPSLAWTSDLDTGFNVDSDGDVGVSKDGIGILETSGTTTSLRSPDGTEAATLTDDGVFAAPGLLRYAYVFRVHDEGMVYGTTTTNAAANKTAWAAMIAKIAASSEPNVDIHIDDDLPMDVGINLHHALSAAKIINIVARPGRGAFLWNGATGDCLTVGGVSTSQLAHSGIYDLYHYFDDARTSGATIQLGEYAGDFTIAGGAMKNSGAGKGSFWGINALVGFALRHYKIELESGTSEPVGVRAANATNGLGGPQMIDVSIDGDGSTSYALRFVNAGNIDTPILTHCHFKDHSHAILKNSGAGDIANFNSANLYLDACTYGVFVEPVTGADIYSWMFAQTEMAGAKSGIHLSEANSGTIARLSFVQGYITDTATAGISAVYVGTGVDKITLANFNIEAGGLNSSGDYGIDFVGTSAGHLVKDNHIAVGSSASGAARYAAGCDPISVTGNIYRGVDATFGGSTGASRVNANNAFLA